MQDGGTRNGCRLPRGDHAALHGHIITIITIITITIITRITITIIVLLLLRFIIIIIIIGSLRSAP